MGALTREVVEAALTLAARAPSAHNAQPWRVRAAPDRVSVVGDVAGWLRHGDPTRRDWHLGLGAFVEALRIAFAASGVRVEPAPPDGDLAPWQSPATSATFAMLRLEADGAVTASDREAASLLRRRQTSRLPYAPRAPEPAALTALATAARESGLELHLMEKGQPERQDLDGWYYAAVRENWLDVRATAELARWLRFDPEGAMRPDDGLSTHSLGLSLPETVALAALARPSLWRAAHAAWLAAPLAAALARGEAGAFCASPLAAVLVAPSEAGAHGAALLRVWLAATRLGLALAPVSTLVDRRGWELGRRLGVAPSRLVAAFRLGRSAPPPRSGRRAVTRFASFSGTALASAAA